MIESTALITPDTDQRIQALYREGERIRDIARVRIIKDNADLKPATDDLTLIAGFKKSMESLKKEYLQPIKDKLSDFNDAFKNFMAPFEEADNLTRTQVTQYRAEVARKQAEAEEINRQAIEVARKQAALNGTGEITVDLTPVEAPADVPKTTHTGLGTTGTMKVWKWEVVDFAALPDEYKLPDAATLNSIVKKNHDAKQIPGLRIYCEETLTVRTKL